MNNYRFFVTIKINCGGIINKVMASVGIYAASIEEAKKLLRTNTTLSIEEPIERITEC